MNKKFTRFLSALLSLCMVVTAFAVMFDSEHNHVHAETEEPTSTATGTDVFVDDGTASTIRKQQFNSAEEKLATMTLYLEAYDYELWALATTGEVAIRNKKTGEVLFTNPYDANQHVSSTATTSAKASTFEQLSSQILLQYTDTTGATKDLCSYKDAAERAQISVSAVKNGISVDYVIGRLDARRICPMTVTRDFMENEVLALIEDTNDYKKIYPQYYTLFDSLTGDYSEKTLANWYRLYPVLEKMEIYALNENATDYEKNKIESILKAWCPKVTYETVEEQHAITEYEAKASVLPCFRMSIIYKLESDGFTIKLPANSIVFNEDEYTLKNITLLPYFGAGSSTEGGFTLIPDGTGTVIEFEDVKDSSVVLTGTLYGADYSYHTLPTSFTGKSQAMRFPVFGVVDNKVEEKRYFIDDDNDPTNDIPYCKHSYNDVVTPPTCTEGGYTTSTCTLCTEGTPGHIIKKDFTDPAHTYDETVEGSIVIDRTTCIHLGKTTYKCTVCQTVTVVEDTEYADHNYVGTPSDIAGITKFECADCGKSYVAGHDEHNLVQIGKIDPSCAEGTYDKLKGNVYTYVDGKLTLFVRDYDVLKFKEGETLTLSDGTKGTITSVNLVALLKEDIKALTDAATISNNAMANNELKRFQVEITITADISKITTDGVFEYSIPKHVTQGYTMYYCSVCGYFEKKGFSYDQHNYKVQNDKTVTASCTEDGKTYYLCACGAERVVTTPAAHTWSETGTATDKFITSAGKIVNADAIDPNKMPLFSHKCVNCDEVLLRVKDVCKKDDLGNETHKYKDAENVVTSEGDCTHYRVTRKTCYLCGTVTTVTAKAYSHNIVRNEIAPTCTDLGYTEFSCTDCGITYLGDFKDPTHNYTETVVENTCTKDGSIKYDCADCGHTYTEVLPAAHKNVDTVVDPTCTEGGYTLHECSVCGQVTKDTETEATHKWSKPIITKFPTATEEGERYFVCTVPGCNGRKDVKDAALGTGGLDYYTVKQINSQGYVAVLTEGESFVTITSNHGGPLHPYNSTYITLNPRPSDTYNLRDSLSVGADAPWTVVSKRKYTGNYSMKIYMVTDNKEGKYTADVSGMAAAYRDHLGLDKLTTEENIPLYIEALGATDVQTTILSFPVYLSTALTTFEDLKTMADELKEYNITNVNFKLTGFANGGMNALVPNGVDFEKVVGGNAGYSDFVKYAEENGIGVATEFDFAYRHATGMFDGYSDKNDATQTIDGRYIMKKEYNPTFQMFETTGLLSISPSVFMKFYKNLSPELAELGYKGISASTLGSDLNSDFDEDEPYNREDSKEFVIALLEKMKEDSGDNVIVDGGNAYVYPYVSHILNMANTGSNYLDASGSVPFISMALHSYVNYAGLPTNQSSNIKYEILKMIENGSNPYFILCAQNTEALKEDKNLSKYYSIAYDIWMKNEDTVSDENIVDIYNRINKAIKDVQSADYVAFEYLIGERITSEAERTAYKEALEAKLLELDEKVKAAEKAFVDAQALYIRLLQEGRAEEADKYYGNINEKLVLWDEARAAYNDQKKKVEVVAGYNEDGTYNTTDYTVADNSIAYVEYSNGVYFILNYNNFDVSVTIGGETIVVKAMDYYKNTK